MLSQGNSVTIEDTAVLLTALATYQSKLDENDEHLSLELIPCLNRLRTILESLEFEDIPNTSFSEVDLMTLTEAHIRSGYLCHSEDKRDGIMDLGKAAKGDTGSTPSSFNATAEALKLVRKHVSILTEARCHMLINVILPHLASAMQGDVTIIPTFPIAQTTFETSSGKHSFSGVVDYLLASSPPRHTPFLRGGLAVDMIRANSDMAITVAMIKVLKNEDLPLAMSQAAIAAASYCKQHKLPVLRGCITSGEEWWFFVYKCDDVASGAGGKISYTIREINLEGNLQNLPLF